MEASSDVDRMLAAFISQLLSGVVESVCQQGYQVAFLASKCGGGSNDILSLHGGLSLNIQKQLEVNFKNLIKEAAQDGDWSISESEEETIQSNHPVGIPITDVLAAPSSHYDLTPYTRTVMESAAYTDTIKVECTAKFDGSLTVDSAYSPTTDNEADEPVEYTVGDRLQINPEPPSDQTEYDDRTSNIRTVMEPAARMDTIKVEYNSEFDGSLTDDTEYSQTIDDGADEPLEYNDGITPEDGQNQQLHIKPEPPCELQIASDNTQTLSYPDSEPSHEKKVRRKKKCKYCKFTTRCKIELMYHTRTHNDEKPFACTECPYRSTERTGLKKHIMIHTGERLFACPECSYRSTKQSNINRHILTHTGEKPFTCPYCPFRSAQMSYIKVHINRRHSVNP